MTFDRKAGIALLVVIALTVAAAAAWRTRSGDPVYPGLARTNGRIEAERIDIATKFAGRLTEVLVAEGDVVSAGQVLARLDTSEIEAQRHEAEATKRQAEQKLDEAVALLAQRKSELALADQQLKRSQELVEKGFASVETVDLRRTTKLAAEAAVNSANAQIAQAKAGIDVAAARVQRLQIDIADHALEAPRAGRIQYRLALPGEVLAAGGKVVTLLDLTDVHMTVFLPTREAGRLEIGSEARLIFDAAPEWTVPATVSFVAADAQFTPKYVETKVERDKLMFRVKLRLPKDVLERHANMVKTGVPGIAYVKIDRQAQWPARLAVKLPR